MLERAKLVEQRVIGREHLMRLRVEPFTAVQDWIAQQRNFWAQQLQAIDDLLAATSTAARFHYSEEGEEKMKAMIEAKVTYHFEENNSVVTLTIEPTDDGCVATIVHSMDAKWAEYVNRRKEVGIAC